MNNSEKPQLAGKVLFRLFGVPWTITGQSWKFIPPKFMIGLIVAFLAFPDQSVLTRVTIGLVYGLLLILLLICHIIGHTLGGKWVDAPMDENHITPMLIETRYYDEDPAEIPKRIHLIRTLAGPLTNLLLALVSAGAWLLWGGHIFVYFAMANLILTIFVLLPFPTVDGVVIWRELHR